MKIIIKPDLDREDVWIEAFGAAWPELECVVWNAAVDPASIDYAFVWNQGDGALQRFPNLKCIFSLGAGEIGSIFTFRTRNIGTIVIDGRVRVSATLILGVCVVP